MGGIQDYVGEMIRSNTEKRLDHQRWGNCPLCGKEVIKGKRAFGCSDWREGCSFVLEPTVQGIALSEQQVRTLLQMRVLPHPIRVGDEPRIVILSTQGVPMDLRLPSADRQQPQK